MTRSNDHDDAILDAETEAELVVALRAALNPAELDPRVNDQLIAAALEDPFAPPTEAELLQSERLRQALEGGPDVADAALARALTATSGRQTLDAERGEQLVTAAVSRRSSRRNVVYVAFGSAAALVTLAAAALLVVVPTDQRTPKGSPTKVHLASSRTSGDLFAEKFERGQTTERVDRIYEARLRDLRKNRYLAWGVE